LGSDLVVDFLTKDSPVILSNGELCACHFNGSFSAGAKPFPLMVTI